MVMFKALDAVKILQVSARGELEGFDLDQHGAAAYPEFVISTLTQSHAVGGDTDDSTNLSSAQVAGAE